MQSEIHGLLRLDILLHVDLRGGDVVTQLHDALVDRMLRVCVLHWLAVQRVWQQQALIMFGMSNT